MRKFPSGNDESFKQEEYLLATRVGRLMPEHTPAPKPARGIYGFAFYVLSLFLAGLYFVWAVLPEPLLVSFGLNYWPAKYWAIAIPLLAGVLLAAYLCCIFAVNLIRLHDIFESVEVVEHDFGVPAVIHLDFAPSKTSPRPNSGKSHKSDYREIVDRRAENETKKEIAAQRDSGRRQPSFPLAREQLIELVDSSASPQRSSSKSTLEGRPSMVDRGYYVTSSQFQDDYVQGSALEIPANDLDIGLNDQGKSRKKRSKKSDVLKQPGMRRFGPEDAVEHIAFQLPHQPSSSYASTAAQNPQDSAEDDDDWLTKYGTVDTSIPPSSSNCQGCGAQFHCQDTALPGFVPVELFIEKEKKNSFSDTLCRRCYLLKKHNFLLNVNVSAVNYRALMSQLKMREEVLLLLVVDMTDLPGSIFRALPDVIGEQKPMIVIGNKVDLLPPDASRGYLRHFKDSLTKAIDEVGFSSRFNILHTTVVSAKTGFGIEELITNIHLKWANPKSEVRSDMFLVGCTNAGKSTLFNTFLQSDMCKVRAVDLIERATTSVWPGTTLNLLKFPVMNPVPYKLEVRRRRLNQTNAWLERERKLRQQLLSETGEAQYAVLQGCVENSFEEQHKESQPISEREFVARQKSERQMFVEEPATKKDSPKIWDPNEEAFAGGSWCFDTPGTVTEDQIINKLTLEELIVVVPKQLIRPRTSLIYPGQSLLLGGLGRIDIGRASGERRGTIMLTVFASDQLPVHVMPTEHVERFVSKYNGTKELGAPLGGPDRLKLLPGMRSRPLSITGKGAKESAADITLSSTGWVAVTAPSGTTVELFAYTPGGVGIITRPSFLPFAVNQRGARIPGTNSYKVRPLGSYEEKYRSRREFLKPRRRRDSLFNGRNDDEDEDDDEMSPVAL